MKKLIAVLLVTTLTLTTLTACGSSKNTIDDKTIVVGASSTPHAEILNAVKGFIEEKGYTLEIKEFSDYVLPNTSLNEGELDANFFQHLPYLESFNKENGTSLVSVADIHYEPIGIYSNSIKSLDELKEGDKVAVPNDSTNEARALLLLQDQGLITLNENAGVNATKKDIVDNKLNLDIIELEAAQIPRSLPDVTIGIINGNYAIQAGLSVNKDAIVAEANDSLAASTYENILVVKEGNENAEAIKVLLDALTSETAKQYMESTYNGAVVPIGKRP